MQQRQNPTPPGPQTTQPAQAPPVRQPNSENLHALQKAIDTMEEKGKIRVKKCAVQIKNPVFFFSKVCKTISVIPSC